MAPDSVNLPEGYQLDQPGVPEGYTIDPETSVPGAFGRGALNAVPFGTKGAAAVEAGLGSGSYKDYLDELDRFMKSDVEQHPIAHTTGEIAGTVAPFLIPGVGQALGAETLVGRAGIGAGLGALQGASNTRQDLTSSEGMKDIAKSAGMGAILNPAIGAVGDVVGLAGSKLAGSVIPERLDAAAFAKANGFNPLSMKKLAQMEGTNPEAALKDISFKLSEIVPDNYYAPTSSINQKYAMLQDLKKQAGEIIGASRQGATEAEGSALEEGQKAIDELVHKAENYQDVANPEGANTIKQAAAMLQSLKEKGQLNFDTLQAIKSKVGENYQNPANVKPGTDEIYSTLSEHLDKALDRLAPSNPNIDPQAFQKAKTTYSLTSKVLPLMLRGAGREVQSAITPMKSAFGLGALATGHPMGALAAAGKAAQEIAAPELPANLYMAAKGLKTGIPTPSSAMITSGATNAMAEPKIPQQYMPVFQKATQGLQDQAERQKQMTVTDFVLQSRDPNYVKAKAEMP